MTMTTKILMGGLSLLTVGAIWASYAGWGLSQPVKKALSVRHGSVRHHGRRTHGYYRGK